MDDGQKRYEPIHHSTLSRAGHAIGEGAQRGFWGGLKGAALGYFALPLLVGAITVGLAAAGGTATIGGMFLAGGIVTGLTAAIGVVFNVPLAMLGTTLGIGTGLFRGARDSSQRTNHEISAARYMDGYNAQMQTMQTQLAAEAARQAQLEEAMMQQLMAQRHKAAEPAPHAPKTISHEPAATHDHAHAHPKAGKRPGDDYPTASTHLEAPETNLSKAEMAHEGRAHAPQLAAAR